MRKLIIRIACILLFISDIPLLLMILMLCAIGWIICLLRRTMSSKEYWNELLDGGAFDELKIVYVDLWRSFKDGELYS